MGIALNQSHVVEMGDTGSLVELFCSIGLSEQKAKETIKNEIVSSNLKQVIAEVCLLFIITGTAVRVAEMNADETLVKLKFRDGP